MGLIFSLLRLLRSSSSDNIAATLHDGDGLERPLTQEIPLQSESDAEVDMSVVSSSDSESGIEADIDAGSSSDSDSESDLDEEELESIKAGNIVRDAILAHLNEPRDTDIICYCQGEPGKRYWMAIAPEYPNVLPPCKSSMEKAAAELQSMLESHKGFVSADYTQHKNMYGLKTVPLNPCTQRARKIRMGYRDGDFDKSEKDDYDRDEKESCAVVWSKVRA